MCLSVNIIKTCIKINLIVFIKTCILFKKNENNFLTIKQKSNKHAMCTPPKFMNTIMPKES